LQFSVKLMQYRRILLSSSSNGMFCLMSAARCRMYAGVQLSLCEEDSPRALLLLRL
jgi:hypothetical protein